MTLVHHRLLGLFLVILHLIQAEGHSSVRFASVIKLKYDSGYSPGLLPSPVADRGTDAAQKRQVTHTAQHGSASASWYDVYLENRLHLLLSR
jgi:hypothetical protein